MDFELFVIVENRCGALLQKNCSHFVGAKNKNVERFTYLESTEFQL